MRALDPRLLRYARATRTFLFLSVALGSLRALLIVGQAWLLVDVVVGAFSHGKDLAQLRGPLIALLCVVFARALVAWAAELAAGRSSARAKSQLRRVLLERVSQLGLDSSRTQNTGELTVLATRGLDALDGYFSLYLPQLLLAVIVPLVVLVAVVSQDWISAAIIAFTLPLIPLFMALVGAATREKMDRQVRTLQRLAGHFLDVVAGLPTLKVFGRAKAQAASIRSISERYRETALSQPACDIFVLTDPRAGRDDLSGAGRRGDRVAPDGRRHVPARRVVRSGAGARGISTSASIGRQLSRKRRRGGRGRAGVRGARRRSAARAEQRPRRDSPARASLCRARPRQHGRRRSGSDRAPIRRGASQKRGARKHWEIREQGFWNTLHP